MRRYIIILTFLCSVSSAFAQLDTDRLVSIGRNALYFEDYVLSIQYFNQAIKAKPYLIEPYFYRAIAKIQLEDINGAHADLDIVIDRNPFIPMAFYARGYTNKRKGNWDEAEADFTKALEFSPDNDIYIVNRIEVYTEKEDFDRAIFDINYLLRKTPESVELNFEKGRILLEMKDTVQAIETFDYLTTLDSLNSDAWSIKGLAYLIVDSLDIALECYDKAVQAKSNSIATYINRGIINYRKKNYRTALSDYDMAVKIDSTNINALFNRALLSNEVGNYHLAIKDLTSIISIDQTSYEAIYQRAVINAELGYVDESITDYTTVLNAYPRFIPAMYARANLYDKLGRTRSAYFDRQKAYEIREEERAIAAKGGKVDDDDDEEDKGIDVSVKVDSSNDNIIKNRSNLFAANANDKLVDGSIRGTVQNYDVMLENITNYQLSYYRTVDDKVPHYGYNHFALQKFNQEKRLTGELFLVTSEMKLTSSLINYHFNSINKISSLITEYPYNSDLYLERAYAYALIQDFANAITDLSKAIFYGEDVVFAYFTRANLRYKQLEFMINNQNSYDEITDLTKEEEVNNYKLQSNNILNPKTLFEQKYSYEFELIMRDYDKVIELLPDFAFAWYNRGNMLCIQRDYKSAIVNYTNAINIQPDFGEAYFNRGLTYIYLGDSKRGIADLSKAGELGIYKAYGVLKKVQRVIDKGDF